VAITRQSEDRNECLIGYRVVFDDEEGRKNWLSGKANGRMIKTEPSQLGVRQAYSGFSADLARRVGQEQVKFMEIQFSAAPRRQ
jgi:hypothetical protein